MPGLVPGIHVFIIVNFFDNSTTGFGVKIKPKA